MKRKGKIHPLSFFFVVWVITGVAALPTKDFLMWIDIIFSISCNDNYFPASDLYSQLLGKYYYGTTYRQTIIHQSRYS